MDGDAAAELVGTIGRITVPVPESGPGEVFLSIRGGTESFAAWSDEVIDRGSAVVVVEVLSPRSLFVTPFPEANPLVVV